MLGKRSYPNKLWLTNETLQVIEQRRKARLLGDMTTYRRLNGVQNRLIHRDRTQFVARKADEIELAAERKTWVAYSSISETSLKIKLPPWVPSCPGMVHFSLTKVLVLSGGRTTSVRSSTILVRLRLLMIVPANLAVKDLEQMFLQMSLSAPQKFDMQ